MHGGCRSLWPDSLAASGTRPSSPPTGVSKATAWGQRSIKGLRVVPMASELGRHEQKEAPTTSHAGAASSWADTESALRLREGQSYL